MAERLEGPRRDGLDEHSLMAIEAVFEEDGELGLILASTDGECGRVRLAGIAPGSQAERCPGLVSRLEAGLLLEALRVGESTPLDVRTLGYIECQELIRTHVRPLTFFWAPMVEPTLAPPSMATPGSADFEPEPADGDGTNDGDDDDGCVGKSSESGIATLRRRVSQVLLRNATDGEAQDVGAIDLADTERESGLRWTSSNPESLGQLPRVELPCGAQEEPLSRDGPAAISTPRSVGAADLETQWKDRERAAHREGYLWRREDGFLSRWQRRWFVVDYGVLNVYKDYDVYCKEKRRAGQDAVRSPSLRRRSSSSRQIVVDGHDVLADHAAPCNSPDTRGQEEFDFVIQLPMDRMLTLRASNQDDKEAWMHAIQFGKTIKLERDSLAPIVKLVGQDGDIPHALEHPTVRIDDIYCMGELLGAGEIGRVYRATHRLTNEAVAVKVVDKTNFSARLSSMRRMASREIIVLTQYNMRHPHIVQTRAVIETADWIFVVMELMKGEELQKNIEKRGMYTEEDAAEVMLRLALTLGFLHSQGIVHRDVKPENILCGSTHVDIKLADFGFATVLGRASTGLKSVVGTPVFMAPEVADVMNPGGYSCAVDIWSAGILLSFMLTGTIPFDPSSPQEMADRRKDLQTAVLEMEAWKHISAEAKDLVCRMLCYDCDDRIAPIEIINHPWITKNCTARPDLARLMSESHMLSANSPVQEEYDLHNGVLTGLGVVTIDAAKLSADAALWVGGIPDHVVADGGRAASAHLRSLFEPFGEIVSVTVRTKSGSGKSWAILSFATQQSALNALKADIIVEPPGPGMQALRLNVKRAAVKEELQKGSTGALGSIAKQHASTVLVTESTVWVGGLPDFAIETTKVAPEEQLLGIFSRFGSIVSITVRRKPGTNKSWALVTFCEVAAATEALKSTVIINDEQDTDRATEHRTYIASFAMDVLSNLCEDTQQDTEVALDVRRAELTMETDGALADISAKHEQEVQNQNRPVLNAVVLDVVDVCETAPAQSSVTGSSISSTGETTCVENRRAKLTDVWQPRKKS